MSANMKFQSELSKGWEALSQEDLPKAKMFFEHAHAAGVFSIYLHGRAHFGKLNVALREKNLFAVVTQIFFLVAAVLSPVFYLLHKLKVIRVRDPEITIREGKSTFELISRKG